MLRVILVCAFVLGAVGFDGSALAQDSAGRPAATQGAERYFCPMKCEGEKTYDAPGKCPVCHMKLKAVPAGPSLTVQPQGELKGGQNTDLVLTIKDASGSAPKGIEGAPVHVVMVSRDLAWFAHDRPPAKADGTLRTAQKFPPGEYLILATYASGADSLVTVSAPISVPGKAPIPKAMGVDADRPKTVEGVTVALDGYRDLRAGREATLAFRMTSGGRPVEALKQAGSDHLTAVSQDLRQIVHTDPVAGGSAAEPTFAVRLDRPGQYRLWAEFRIGEKTLVFPFVVEVAEGTEGK